MPVCVSSAKNLKSNGKRNKKWLFMRSKNIWIYPLIAIFIIVFDQLSKIYIVNNMVEGQMPVQVFGDFLRFSFVFNTGGAMGTMIGPPWLYLILTIIALTVIIKYFTTLEPQDTLIKTALALVFGGAVGNLIDRLRFGKVVDFIDADFPDIAFLNIERWYTFNIADAAITVGLVFFAITAFISKKNKEDEAEPPEDSQEI